MKDNDRKPIRILVTGVGHPIARGLMQSLRSISEHELFIIGVDLKERGNGFPWVDTHYIVPMAKDSSYLPRLLDICEKEKPNVLVPWSDSEVFAISRELETFKGMGVIPLCSPHSVINHTLDKGAVLQELQRIDLPTPEFTLASSVEEVVLAAEQLGYPEKRVVIKPRMASCSCGLWILDYSVDLMQHFPGHCFPLPALIAILNEAQKQDKNIPEYLVMEYLEGEDYSVDVLAEHGEPIFIIPRRRVNTVDGISRISEVMENEEIRAMVSQVIRHFGLHLNTNVQLILPHDGAAPPMVYEINPRISGTIIANDGAGVSLFYYGILLALNLSIPRRDSVKVQQTTMVRSWMEHFIPADEWFLP